jgi:hypothetical protein
VGDCFRRFAFWIDDVAGGLTESAFKVIQIKYELRRFIFNRKGRKECVKDAGKFYRKVRKGGAKCAEKTLMPLRGWQTQSLCVLRVLTLRPLR